MLGAVAGDHSTIVMDAGNSVAHARTFLDSISQYSVPPIRYLFFTHAHWDHVFGMQAFPDVVSLAHSETAKRIQELSQLEWDDQALDERVERGQEVAYFRDMIKAELPNRAGLQINQPSASFERRMQIDLGDTHCLLEWIGGDHASDASIAYIPSERIVFLGDCLYPQMDREGRRYQFRNISRLLERVLTYDAECYLLGHSPIVISRSRIEYWRNLLRTLERKHGKSRENLERSLEELISNMVETGGFSAADN